VNSIVFWKDGRNAGTEQSLVVMSAHGSVVNQSDRDKRLKAARHGHDLCSFVEVDTLGDLSVRLLTIDKAKCVHSVHLLLFRNGIYSHKA